MSKIFAVVDHTMGIPFLPGECFASEKEAQSFCASETEWFRKNYPQREVEAPYQVEAHDVDFDIDSLGRHVYYVAVYSGEESVIWKFFPKSREADKFISKCMRCKEELPISEENRENAIAIPMEARFFNL